MRKILFYLKHALYMQKLIYTFAVTKNTKFLDYI